MLKISKILLIDDEPKLIADILKAYGYEADVVSDGLTGLQFLFEQKRYYDLVLLDLLMPGIDGWTVLKSIREDEDYAAIPIILLTSMDSEDTLVTGLTLGADEYLIKPVTPKRLVAHIHVVERRLPWKGDADFQESQKGLKLLTPRETELLRYVFKGYSNHQIAQELSVSETTVKNHLAHIYKKLKVENRTQAAFLAKKLSLI